jgi:restriction system protein
MGDSSRTTVGHRWLATDPRPIFGGQVVLHAMRGEAAGAGVVHALAGAVSAAGATKGILVSLGGITPEAYEARAGRPLELIDGPGLVTLLANHCRIKARIEVANESATSR